MSHAYMCALCLVQVLIPYLSTYCAITGAILQIYSHDRSSQDSGVGSTSNILNLQYVVLFTS